MCGKCAALLLLKKIVDLLPVGEHRVINRKHICESVLTWTPMSVRKLSQFHSLHLEAFFSPCLSLVGSDLNKNEAFNYIRFIPHILQTGGFERRGTPVSCLAFVNTLCSVVADQCDSD